MASGHAQTLVDDRLLNDMFDQLEQIAMESAVIADPSDDEMRRTCTQEVRAIRAVRRKLKALAREKTNPTPGTVI